MGTTLAYLVEQRKVDKLEDLSPGLVKRSMTYVSAPASEEWRIHLALELKDILENVDINLDNFTSEEVKEMLDFTCIT